MSAGNDEGPVSRMAPNLFGPESKFKKKNVLNRSIIPSSQSSQFCFVKIALFYNFQNH